MNGLKKREGFSEQAFWKMNTAKMTSKQYLMLGEDPPGVRLELAMGEVVVTPGQTPEHSSLMLALGMMLDKEIKARVLGKLFLNTDVVFDDLNVRRPDIVFYSKHRLHLARECVGGAAGFMCRNHFALVPRYGLCKEARFL